MGFGRSEEYILTVYLVRVREGVIGVSKGCNEPT